MAGVPYTLRIDPRLKAGIEQQAKLEKRSTAFILQQAAEEYLERKRSLNKMIARLEAEADKGVFISEQAMDAWVNSWSDENESPEPEPDIFLHSK